MAKAKKKRVSYLYEGGGRYIGRWQPATTVAAMAGAALVIGEISAAGGLERLPEVLGKGVAGGRELLVGAAGFGVLALAGSKYPTVAQIGMSVGVAGLAAGLFSVGRQDAGSGGKKRFAFLTDTLGLTKDGIPIPRNADGTKVKGLVGVRSRVIPLPTN